MKTETRVMGIVVLVTAFIIADSGCREDMLTKQQIIDIANKEVISQGLQLDQKKVCYDVGNVQSKGRIASIRQENPDFAERFKVLDGRDYQAVLYEPKKLVLGGFFCVFVDRKTGQVITFYGER